MVPGAAQRVAVENDEGTLRMAVNGRAVCERKEPASIIGDGFDRVGFRADAPVRLERVRVWLKRLEDGYW